MPAWITDIEHWLMANACQQPAEPRPV